MGDPARDIPAISRADQWRARTAGGVARLTERHFLHFDNGRITEIDVVRNPEKTQNPRVYAGEHPRSRRSRATEVTA
jgi:hypothetical protein